MSVGECHQGGPSGVWSLSVCKMLVLLIVEEMKRRR